MQPGSQYALETCVVSASFSSSSEFQCGCCTEGKLIIEGRRRRDLLEGLDDHFPRREISGQRRSAFPRGKPLNRPDQDRFEGRIRAG